MLLNFAFAKDVSDKALNYEVVKQNNHVIHILKINPNNYRLELAQANDASSNRETVPSMVARTKAIAGINGGFFQMQGGKAKATGTLIVNGNVYSLSNGMRSVLIIDQGKAQITKAQVIKRGQTVKLQTSSGKMIVDPKNVVTGIPMLVMNGRIAPYLNKSGSASFVNSPHARTAIGTQKDGTVIMVVAENGYGSVGATGLTLPELANFMLQLKCEQAMNLDGGGSSTLVYDGEVQNSTIGDLDEAMGLQTVRPVFDGVLVQKR
jgi:exopolysaccharide biosynthesis protein